VYFAPTSKAGSQLISEGKSPDTVFVTGNTVIDAIQYVNKKLNSDKDLAEVIDEKIGIERDRPFVLVTQHRRESFGDDLFEIFSAVLEASHKHPEVLFLVPLHKNPNVVEAAKKTILNKQNVRIIQSLDYFEMVRILQNTILIVTDSGGLQEEAPAMNIPVLITRKVTERPEVVDVGAAKLVGTSREVIFDEIDKLLSSQVLLDDMRNKANPFGDGTASQQIIRIIDDIDLNLTIPKDSK
jgi:UDP-N-acetylglucosamine 2-epimerase (non-hydrolysing)